MTGFNQRGSRTSEVEVRLAPGPTGDTEFELIHAAVADPHFFPTYGPGAGGVGWDLGLLTLARLLADDEIENLDEFEKSPEGRELSRRSAAAWGQAHLAAGGDPEQVAASGRGHDEVLRTRPDLTFLPRWADRRPLRSHRRSKLSIARRRAVPRCVSSSIRTEVAQ